MMAIALVQFSNGVSALVLQLDYRRENGLHHCFNVSALQESVLCVDKAMIVDFTLLSVIAMDGYDVMVPGSLVIYITLLLVLLVLLVLRGRRGRSGILGI